jgi:toxin ParE1/3/4
MFDIWATIAVDSERAADRLIARFYAAEELLGAFPEIGEARTEIAAELRKWTVTPYVML